MMESLLTHLLRGTEVARLRQSEEKQRFHSTSQQKKRGGDVFCLAVTGRRRGETGGLPLFRTHLLFAFPRLVDDPLP